MKNLKLKNHLLSALGVAFFIFIAFGSDETNKNQSNTTTENNTQSENNPQSLQEDNENLNSEPKKETPYVLNTDRILALHIKNLKAGCKLTRQIWLSNDQTEIKNLRDKREKIRTNNPGDFSQINDAMFFKKTYSNAYSKCVSIAEQISQSDNESEIDKLITDAMVYQTLAWDAYLYIQTPDLNYPQNKIEGLSNTYKIVSAIFADETVLKLPIADFKIAVTNALPDLQQSKKELSKL